MTFFPKFTSWPVQLDPTTLERVGRKIRAITPPGVVSWGDIIGNIALQSDLVAVLVQKVTSNPAILSATKTKISYDTKGLVTSGADATTADIADSLNKRYVTDANLLDIAAITGKVTANVAVVPATKTKIAYDAKGLVTSGTDATTADIADSLNKRYVTDANLVTIGTSGKKDFTYQFGQNDNLAVNQLIPCAGSGLGYWQTNGVGIYIQSAQNIKEWGVIVPAFLSANNAHQTTFNLRVITPTGNLTADITGASGSSLRTYSLVYGKNDSILHFYKGGGESGLNISVSAGDMLFVTVSSQNVAQARGAMVVVYCKEQ